MSSLHWHAEGLGGCGWGGSTQLATSQAAPGHPLSAMSRSRGSTSASVLSVGCISPQRPRQTKGAKRGRYQEPLTACFISADGVSFEPVSGGQRASRNSFRLVSSMPPWMRPAEVAAGVLQSTNRKTHAPLSQTHLLGVSEGITKFHWRDWHWSAEAEHGATQHDETQPACSKFPTRPCRQCEMSASQGWTQVAVCSNRVVAIV